ncbi:phage tail family protein [Bacillus methanolicus]|uniref:distal tail protein Dit n=1 Tax=Bacillus methanolicus TaxID=1471 RepID=UPI00200F49AE|nr:distal tail protein Dit [Bacillus methanolicus]UQD53300.1 phage tail family protein [Bacillus methanolicus]
MTSFTFNGERRDYIIVLRGRKRPPWAPVQRNILRIPGLSGGYLQNTDTDIRVLEVPVLIQGDDQTHLQRVKEDLAAWLVTDEAKELIFDDDPTRTYYAVVDDTVDFDEIVQYGQGTIRFLCPDPYVYGPEQTIEIPNTEGQSVIVQNNGSAPTFPKFTVTVNQPTTFLDIITPTDYMRIGRPVSVEELEVEREQIMINDDCQSTTGWGSATEIDGTATGTMESDGKKFYASSYGTGSGWHGPALKKSLSTPIQDFIVEVWVTQRSTAPNQVGRAEFYLLDANNKVLGKMAMKDWMKDIHLNYGEARIGDNSQGTHIINYAGNYKVWNDFYGILRLKRIGNLWTAYIGKYDINTGRHHARLVKTFRDVQNKWSSQLAQIVVHLGVRATYPATTQFIDKVKVWKVNQNITIEIPYIAEAGDVIEIDHANNSIFKNGEPFLSAKDFGANFFALERGQTEIAVNPEGIADVEMTFRERWK